MTSRVSDQYGSFPRASSTALRRTVHSAHQSYLRAEFARIRAANAHVERPAQGMPTPDDPVLHNEEPGMWRMQMEGFHSRDPHLSHSSHSMLSQMQDQLSVMGPDQSLTEVTHRVFDHRGTPQISTDRPGMQTYFIPHSVTPQYDMRAHVELDPEFAELIGVRTDGLFDTQHVFLKNGLNGIYFTDVDGSLVETQNCQAGSWDRESPNLQMARRVAPLLDGEEDPTAPSYYYTGRCDTLPKAHEQGEMIYLGELNAQEPKGLEEEEDGTHTLHYVVNSIQSNSPLYRLGRKKKGREGAEQEQEYFERERVSLAQLRTRTQTVEDRETGEEHRVRFRPMLFSRQVNVFGNLERVLNPWLAGSYQALEASREGWQQLKAYYDQHRDRIPPGREDLAAYLIEKLEHSYNQRYFSSQMSASKELLCRSMLCILLGLPVVAHCKSSTDRTSVLGALEETLNQWIREGMEIPEDFENLHDDPVFKEFFWINWSKGAQFTRNARSPAGIIEQNGFIRENDHEAIGVSINEGIAQCNLLADYLPERLLKDYGATGVLKDLGKKVWKFATTGYSWKSPFKFILGLVGLAFGLIVAGIFLALSPLIALYLTYKNPFGTLGFERKDSGWKYLWAPFCFLYMFFRNWAQTVLMAIPLLNLYFPMAAAPKKVVDFDAPGIGPRRHVKEAKDYQRPFNRPLEAVPANADRSTPEALAAHMQKVHKEWKKEKLHKKTPREIYNLLFETRFCQTDRALRYFLKGNVLDRMQEENAPKPPRTWMVDGVSYRNLDEAHDALLEQGHSQREADDIIRLMENADNLSSHRYLQQILEAPGLNIALSDPEEEETIISYDSGRKTLTIESQSKLIHTSTDETHATIFTETVINADPESDDYGQGYITSELPRREDDSWDFNPF